MQILKMGARGEDVRELQTILADFGFYMGNIDGIFADKTEMAVKRFQKQTNLMADGIVGKNTWMMLNNAMGNNTDFEAHSNGFIKYQAKSGDSLWSLAQKFDTTLDCLMSENGLTSMNIAMGQELIIPVGKTVCAIAMNNEQRKEDTSFNEKNSMVEMQPESNMQKYSVVYGDSLWKIANRFGTTVEAIKEHNGLMRDSLSIGQVLNI